MRNFKFLILVLGLSILLFGCSEKKLAVTQFGFAVIDTTTYDNKSYLSFYDDQMNKLGEVFLPYGTMGDGFSVPKVYKGAMYIIPQGIGNTKNLEIVLKYDIESGQVTTYPLGLCAMNSFCVNDQYVFGVDTINYASQISRVDKNTKQIIKLKIPKEYICNLEIYGNRLYAFSNYSEENVDQSYLYVIVCN